MSQHPQHPPQHPQQQRQHYPSGKKKVEWSSTLSSSEPPPTEDNSPVWDSEADHMLSYFLDGNGLASPPWPMGAAMSGRGNLPGLSDRILQHPFRTDNFPATQQRSMAMAAAAAMRQDQQQPLGLQHHAHDSDNDLRQPPPTPVIQHYFHAPTSSSSRKLSPKSNRGSTAQPQQSQPQPSQQLASGASQPLHQFPFHPPQIQQPQQVPQTQSQIPLDPVQAMKHNFMGAYQQPFPAATATTTTTTTSAKNPYAFQGYNPAMEDAMSPTISPALDFGGNPEPLLLPGKGGVVQATVPKAASVATGAPTAAAGATNHHFAPQIHVLAAGAYQQQQQQPQHAGDLNKGSTPQVLSSQPTTAPLAAQVISQAHVVAAQKQFAQSIPSSEAAAHPVVTTSSGGFPPTMGSIHPAAFYFPHHLTTAFLMQKAESAEETEEKRAKRLERNRESARKSRRRKKERLSNLEDKVNKLYAKIETERRRQIHSMETAWKELGQDELLKLQQELEPNEQQQQQQQPPNLERLWMGETEESIRKEVVEFQYNSLGQHLLPRYQKYFLWMILQEESYFLSGKEEHAKREFSKKITTGKISSKQLGEEISNGPKQPSWQRKSETTPASPPQNQDQTTAHVGESEKFWPLVCFELSISVEQEERFLEAQARFRHAETLRKNVSQIVAATRLASSAKECVLYQIYLAAFRKRKTYQSILTPKQAMLYKQWLLSNRDRVETLVSNRRRTRRSSVVKGGGSGLFQAQGPFLNAHRDEDLTLEQLCRYLEESLKISKHLPDSIPEREMAVRGGVA